MKNTAISWATHTMNFWFGCEEVGPACDGCYAKAWALRAGYADAWQGVRYRTKTWGEPIKWHKEAIIAKRRDSVFANSLSDFFDNHPDCFAMRDDAWKVIADCHGLDWYLVTKRIPNVMKMLPTDWAPVWYRHVVIIITVVTQAEWDRDGQRLKLLKMNFPWLRVGLSMEPLIEAVDLGDCSWLDWVIVGGESGGKDKARPMNPAWALSIRDQCAAAGVSFHFKQWGAWEPTVIFNVSRDLGFWEGDQFRRARWHTVYGRKDSNVIMQSVHPKDQHANNRLDGQVYDAGPRKVAA